MIDLIERIGPIVGVAAFLGLAVLAFLIFQQGREVRRLREWAGRAPERALEADEASLAAAEARGDAAGEERPRGRLAGPFAAVWDRLDRGAPFDPVYAIAIAIAAVLAAGVLTSGFGILGDDADEPGERRGAERGQQRQQPAPQPQPEEPQEVAVLNATQVDPGTGVEIAGVPGLAEKVADEAVAPLDGFLVGAQANAPTGVPLTVIMFDQGARGAAVRLADEVEPLLGETAVEPMSADVQALVEGAPLAILVGQDDADF